MNQRFLLLLHLLGIGDSKGRVDVVARISPVADKSHFLAFTNTLTVFGFFGALDHPNINMKSSDQEFIENDVFHDRVFFLLSKIKLCIAQAC